MPAADLIFWDVAGFSGMSDHRQADLVNGFTELVADQERSRLKPKIGRPIAVALPTGDGCAIAYLVDEGRIGFAKEILELAVSLLRWANEQVPKIGMRVGLHRGVVTLVTDINGRTNVCGDPINVCQRVMDAANEGQVLASNEFAVAHFGAAMNADLPSLSSVKLDVLGDAHPAPQIDQDQAAPETMAAWREATAKWQRPVIVFPLPPAHSILAKHERRLGVWVLAADPDQSWNIETPKSKDQIVVQIDDKPLPGFIERLRKAREIALVQLTGYRIADELLAGRLQLAEDLARFWVLMPDPMAIPAYLRKASDATGVSATAYLQKWREAMALVHSTRPKADVRLLQFRDPAHFGASFLDWRAPGGVIHVSPYVWGETAQRCPRFDMRWVEGMSLPKVFRAYCDGLDALARNSENLFDGSVAPAGA